MANPAVFRNKTDLKRFVRHHDGASDDALVEAINIKLNLSVSATNEGRHHRLDAGRMLLDLRKQIETEHDDWWKWQRGKFNRSRKDIEKLMAMARANDPEAAAEEVKAKDRARKAVGAEFRASHPIDHILKLVRALTDDQRAELFTKLKEEYQ